MRGSLYVTRAVALATVAIGLGDTGRALDWLERARNERFLYLPLVAADPIYEPLHRNARFLQLVRAIWVTHSTRSHSRTTNGAYVEFALPR